MAGEEIRRVLPINNLLVDLQNPRYDPRASQREALRTIIIDQGAKLLNLAEDIVDRGLNPSDLCIATPYEQPRDLRGPRGQSKGCGSQIAFISPPSCLS